MTYVEFEVELEAMSERLITGGKYQEDEEKERGQRQQWNKKLRLPYSPYLSLLLLSSTGRSRENLFVPPFVSTTL